MTNVYELQAARIETVLGAYKIPARVWSAQVTPRFVRYDLTTALGAARLTRVASLAEELAFSLGVTTARIYREEGVLRVEIPRPTPRLVELEKLCLSCDQIPPVSAVLGVDTAGDPLLLRLDSPDVAHVLLAGTTGSGKTALLRSMLASLAMHNRAGLLQLVLIDPKGRGYGALAALPHVWRGAGAIHAPAATRAVLADLITEMERRDRHARHLPHLVVAIDELADLLQVLGAPAADAIQRLSQRGREAGIHLIAATQRPAADAVSGLIKANFPIRLVGAVASTDDAEVAAGRGGTRAEQLLGRGDFYLVGRGSPIRFQAAYVDERQLTGLVARIRAGGARRRKWTPAPLGQGEPPAALPPLRWRTPVTATGDQAVTALVTVTSDQPLALTKSLPVDPAPARAAQSPVTVTTPCPAAAGPSEAARLDQLLPPGQHIPMIAPRTPAQAELLALAYRVEGGFNPMCARLYGRSPSGELRKKGPVRAWLNAALAHHPGPAAPADPVPGPNAPVPNGGRP